MEINRADGNIIGGVANEDMVEGRMVLLTSHTFDYNYGSKKDLPGFKLPTTADEAERAKFIVTWAEDNRPTPIYDSMPQNLTAMRNGWSVSSNVPFTSVVRLTQPGHQDGVTIPSGTQCLAYGKGSYTVKSGMYIDSASFGMGALLSVSYGSGTEGKLQYQATWDDTVVGVVESWDATTGELCFTSREF
jgi:hypothetical protein